MAFLNPLSFVDNSYADSKNTAISLRIGESIMLPEVSTDSINIELDPTAANGDFKTASVTVGVSTNRTAGYTLTASVEGSETALTNADYDNYEIAALSTKTSASDFADLSKTASMNKWGYATDNNGTDDGQTEAGCYYAMPDVDSPTTLKITDGPAATSETEITFATKGKDLAAGKYENTVVFTAIGNLEATPIENGMYMQDVTPEICADTLDFSASNVEGTTYEVADKRDGQPYFIRKFTFGDTKYCTMVENLNLAGGTTVTYEDTNITSTTTTYLPSTGSSATGTYTLPNSSISGFYANSTTQNMFNGYGRNRDGATYTNTNSSYGSTGTFAVDGAHYNWQVATAGTGGPYGTNRASSGDICPKNWRLFTESERSDINATISNFGINSWYTIAGSASTSGTSTISSSPIYSGLTYSGSLYYAGDSSYWWSSTQDGNSGAHTISNDTNGLKANNYGGNKFLGASVRCLLPAA